jgi:hypothetical protein
MTALVSPLVLLALGAFIYFTNRLPECPPAPPGRPQEASRDAEWLLLPFQVVGGLAGLLWCLILLAVFLAPLAFVVLLALGAAAR